MNRDKQIEEMGEYIAEILHFECGKASCEECKWLGSTNQNADCMDYLAAEKLIAKGYRLASDVAREIFEEIDSLINIVGAMTGLDIFVMGKYAELKKKYTEEITEGEG